MSESPAAKANERPTYRLLLRPEPTCDDPTRALRALLKLALRKWGLRAVSVSEDAERAP
jgi:hypothetical protein